MTPIVSERTLTCSRCVASEATYENVACVGCLIRKLKAERDEAIRDREALFGAIRNALKKLNLSLVK